MSPQSGLPHNNRVGDLDSSALPWMMKTMGITVEEAQRQLCKESGLKALSGGYNDMRDIVGQASKGNAKAQLALDVLAQQTRHWIGAFLIELNGLDALVFTAGIGENNAEIREAVCRNLDGLGIRLDADANAKTKAQEAVISAPESRVKVMVIPTNEELVIAREAKRFLENRLTT
jgi:acetate kinase